MLMACSALSSWIAGSGKIGNVAAPIEKVSQLVKASQRLR